MSIHLDIYTEEAELENLCRSYWALDEKGKFLTSVTQLAKDNELNSATLLEVVSSNCGAYTSNVTCCECDSPYFLDNRASYLSLKTKSTWICEMCEAERANHADDIKQSILINAYEKGLLNHIEVDKLKFRHAVLLIALIKFAGDEQFCGIQPLFHVTTDKFTPDDSYTRDAVAELYHEGIIVIDPDTDLDAIELNESGKYSFNLSRVSWLVACEEGRSMLSFFEELETRFLSKEVLAMHASQILELAKEIGRAECVSFLQEKLEEHQLDFSPGQKTNAVILRLLETFSVAQIYNFIWRAVKDAVAFKVRTGSTRIHAANTVVSNLERQAERALANNWDVTAYRRNYDQPQSIVSRILFNSILKTDDGGFHLSLIDLSNRTDALIISDEVEL